MDLGLIVNKRIKFLKVLNHIKHRNTKLFDVVNKSVNLSSFVLGLSLQIATKSLIGPSPFYYMPMPFVR